MVVLAHLYQPERMTDGGFGVLARPERWLWKTRVEERLQFTRSDEARNEWTGVIAVRTAKRLEREREDAARGYTVGLRNIETTIFDPASEFLNFLYLVYFL